VTKPFSIRELVLRIDARLKARRPAAEPQPTAEAAQPPEAGGRMKVGPLEIDRAEHRVFVSGQEIRVSPLEMRLLLFLVATPGKMRPRKELLTEVWGYHPEVSSRTLDTHIKRIRDKFGDHGDLIQTVRGVGYRIAVRADPPMRGSGMSGRKS
jgi:two-component system phosphate regulon response regulator PhoB